MYLRFSAASPIMIFPPLLLVFSTDSAVLRPCSCFPRPWPSLKPYFCMILWATVPLWGMGREGKRVWFDTESTLKVHTVIYFTSDFCVWIFSFISVYVHPTHPMLARKELVGPGGERGRSKSSYIGGGMAAFEPLAGRPSSSWGYETEPIAETHNRYWNVVLHWGLEILEIWIINIIIRVFCRWFHLSSFSCCRQCSRI